MNRWVKVGGAVLLLAWTPFLYAELTSDPQEKKGRVLPEDQDPDEIAVEPAEDDKADEPSDDEKGEPVKAPEPAPAVEEIEPAAADELAEAEGEEPAAAEPAPPPTKAGPVPALRSAFDSEPRDALWAKDTETKIAAMLSGGDMPESLFDKAACQKTVCRVDVRWSQENAAPYLDAYEELHQAFGADIAVDPQAAEPAQGAEQGAANTDELALAVHVYVMRKGYTLADIAK
jgi:hypothetical protein